MDWFRLHNSITHSEKHAQLPAELFRFWIYFSALANEYDEDKGELPPLKTIAFRLRLSEKKSEKVLKSLVESGLVDVQENSYFIHDWEQWQYKDNQTPRMHSSSYERVKRFREKQKAAASSVTSSVTETVTDSVSETLHPCPQLERYTHTETETETHSVKRNACNAPGLGAPAPKKEPIPAPDPTGDQIAEVASAMVARHPKQRTCGLAEAKKLLRAVTTRVVAKDRAALLDEIDENHKAWCQSEDWSKEEGRYAKGLANWLAPTVERYRSKPPPPGTSVVATNGAMGEPRSHYRKTADEARAQAAVNFARYKGEM